MRRGHGSSRAWPLLALVLALCAGLAWSQPTAALDWQPALAWRQPWRLWTAAAVHWSGLHLAANLAGCAVVGAFGWAAGATRRAAAGWLLAWPLTQAGLWLRPELLHYGGLSGVLHAGVAVVVLQLLPQPGVPRRLGAAVGLGLLAKLGFEAPWGPALQQWPGWDTAIAPWAHLSGVVAGVAGVAAMALLQRVVRMVRMVRVAVLRRARPASPDVSTPTHMPTDLHPSSRHTGPASAAPAAPNRPD